MTGNTTHAQEQDRQNLIGGARSHGRPVVALLTDTNLAVAQARNAARPDNLRVPTAAVEQQHSLLTAALPTLADEVDAVVHARDLPVLACSLLRLAEEDGDHEDLAEVRRVFGQAASLFEWNPADGGHRTRTFAAGGQEISVRWVDDGDPFDARFEARVPCATTPGCPGAAWTVVHSTADLARAHTGMPVDEVMCDCCDS
ncbi:AAA family ATPase [Streptomyces sp. P1-3]|uniref:AAA family ATPase n=1 Tax=Streptomyces sp. P1-3 TaxID=3421658 RepID=UPI003D36B5AC